MSLAAGYFGCLDGWDGLALVVFVLRDSDSYCDDLNDSTIATYLYRGSINQRICSNRSSKSIVGYATGFIGDQTTERFSIDGSVDNNAVVGIADVVVFVAS